MNTLEDLRIFLKKKLDEETISKRVFFMPALCGLFCAYFLRIKIFHQNYVFYH